MGCSMRETIFATAVTLTLLLSVTAIEIAPASEGPVTVVVNPFGQLSALEVIAAAEGDFVRTSRWRWLAVGKPASKPGFQDNLKQAGALMIFSPLVIQACSQVLPSM
jgi:hypothetical protein